MTVRGSTPPGAFALLSGPLLWLLLFLAGAPGLRAAVRYVNLNSPTPSPPYASWATAARTIQDAVNVAGAGDQILVTNGVYRSGGQAVYGGLTSRVALTQPVLVRSVNGAGVTSIEGAQAMDAGSPVRCVWLTNGAALAGFTLTNGATFDFGDLLSGAGGGVYCDSAECSVSNCVLVGNSAHAGGGAFGGTLYNCALSGNSAGSGGGASESTLYNCTLTGNSALWESGGADASTLNNCIVYYNTPNNYDARSILNSCCTTPLPFGGTGNQEAEPQLATAWRLSAGSPCRGAGSAAYARGRDLDGEPWANPPAIGCDEYWDDALTGGLTTAIAADYTTVAAGFSVNLQAVIAGRAGASVWDFGDSTEATNRPFVAHAWAAAGDYAVVLRAYDASAPGGMAVALIVHVVEQPVHYVSPASAAPDPPYDSWSTAATSIQDAVEAATVPGALVLVSNGVYQTGQQVGMDGSSSRVAVSKPIILQSVNGPAATTINGAGETRCAYLTNRAVLSGFTLFNGNPNVPAGAGGGAWCESVSALLTNCIIATNSAEQAAGTYSGTLSGCLLIGNQGGDSAGAAYRAILQNCTLTANAGFYGGGAASSTLDHCLLLNNEAGDGGGAAESTLNNCTLAGNTSSYVGGGGGAFYAVLNNCLLTNNSSALGGGAASSILNNCTVTGNSALNSGGGVYNNSQLNNCIVYYNTAPDGNYDATCSLSRCCTTPLPSGAAGNFTNPPAFVDQAGGDLRLQSNSPCINAGNNGWAPSSLDLDSQPRIVGGTVDVGAYEFQSPLSTISYAWLQQYGLALDAGTDAADPDHDGLDNWQEWVAGTDPTNPASALRLLAPAVAPPGLLVSWASVTNRSYSLERATALAGSATGFSLLRSHIPGQAGITACTDTNLPGPGPYFYRVWVEP